MSPVQQLHLAGPVFQGVSSASVAGNDGHHASPRLCNIQQRNQLKKRAGARDVSLHSKVLA